MVRKKVTGKIEVRKLGKTRIELTTILTRNIIRNLLSYRPKLGIIQGLALLGTGKRNIIQ